MDQVVTTKTFASRLISVGVSRARQPDAAVREAVLQLDLDAAGLVFAFVPETLEPDATATELAKCIGAIPVFGATTAGQITPEGYENDALLLVAFPRRHFRCVSQLIAPLAPVSIQAVAEAASELDTTFGPRSGWKRLGILFTDGLSKQEDVLVAALEAGLSGTPIFGGSAGHGVTFGRTFVLYEGQMHSDAASFIILETDLAFERLGFHHFLPTDRYMVVTRANTEERLVQEINGAPAAEEYARLVGCAVEDLSPEVFSQNPLLVSSGSAYHVRAIQQVAEDQSLAILSAIDEGLVLSLGRGTEILQTLEAELSVTASGGRRADFLFGFDCFLRRLEIEHWQLGGPASEILRRYRVIGFNTYGEQHLGVHVNQTFVGLAFYPPEAGPVETGDAPPC